MVNAALNIDKKSVIGPVLHLKNDPSTLAIELSEQIGARIGRSLSEIRDALFYAIKRQKALQEILMQAGRY
jgi:hypothetical protein